MQHGRTHFDAGGMESVLARSRLRTRVPIAPRSCIGTLESVCPRGDLNPHAL